MRGGWTCVCRFVHRLGMPIIIADMAKSENRHQATGDLVLDDTPADAAMSVGIWI